MGIYIESDKEHADGALYQALVDEVTRLKRCRNSKERQKIRWFILEAHQKLVKSNLLDANQENVLRDTPQ